MRFDENFNVSLSLNPKREMIKVMKKYLLASLLALLAFVGKAQEDNSDIVKVGDTMPSFTIVSDNGSKLQSASLKGKVILVNFFATWCPPCQKELAAVQQTLWPKYKNNKDFVLLVIGREHTEVEFYHSGDLDYGGIKIFLYIQKNIFPELQPLMMDVRTYEQYRDYAEKIEDTTLEKLKKLQIENPVLRQLAEKLVKEKKGIEQESFLL